MCIRPLKCLAACFHDDCLLARMVGFDPVDLNDYCLYMSLGSRPNQMALVSADSEIVVWLILMMSLLLFLSFTTYF
jgi:hypothetical protein